MKTFSISALGVLFISLNIGLCQEDLTNVSSPMLSVAVDNLVPNLSADDIGAVKSRGSASLSNGTFRVKSAGADIWGNADSFQFTSLLINGDAQIIARVVSIDNAGPWAKAGLMVRESNTEDSRHVLLAATPEHGFSLQYRPRPKGNTREAIPRPVSVARPSDGGTGWLKIIRRGDRISGYSSADGTNWLWEGTATLTNLPVQLRGGLALSSQDGSRVGSAMFDNVTISSLPVSEASAPASPVLGSGDGLRAQYYQNLDFTGKSATRVDETLDFEWDKADPIEGINRGRFSTRWEGEIQAQYTEPYAFHLIADDRARLWINGRLIIEDLVPHAALEAAMRVNLVAIRNQRVLSGEVFL